MKTETYCKFFENEDKAMDWCRTKNRIHKRDKLKDLFVVTDGPENNWAVVDLKTAIEIGSGYKWAC